MTEKQRGSTRLNYLPEICAYIIRRDYLHNVLFLDEKTLLPLRLINVKFGYTFKVVESNNETQIIIKPKYNKFNLFS
jgi:hypothetical protein